MPIYVYKVRDKLGKVLQGQMDASDEKDLRRKLSERDFFIIEYSSLKAKTNWLLKEITPSTRKVTYTDLSVLSWQLHTLLSSSLTLVNSLKILILQTKNKMLKSALAQVCQRVEEGSTFAEALQERPGLFSRFFVQMINAGEVGGVLDEMLRRIAVYYERQAEIRSKVKSAMIYPAILLSMSILVILFLVTVVLPQFASVFADIGATIPWPTQILLQLSFIIKTYLPFFIMVGFGAYVLGRVYVSTDPGGYQFDLFKLKLPLIGDVVNKSMTVQFTQTLATLATGGIPILTALDVVTETIDNKVLVKVLKRVAVSVEGGKPIAQPLEESGLFPEMVVNMIRVGEETGSLDKMLEKIADFYYKDVYNSIDAFMKLVEPLLMMAMAFIIGFIAIAIFLPIASMLQNLH